jgi:hypothetical protein
MDQNLTKKLADWIQKNADEIAFGKIVIEIQVHQHKIFQIDKSVTIRERPEGGSHE